MDSENPRINEQTIKSEENLYIHSLLNLLPAISRLAEYFIHMDQTSGAISKLLVHSQSIKKTYIPPP